jgi:hypothetical protein
MQFRQDRMLLTPLRLLSLGVANGKENVPARQCKTVPLFRRSKSDPLANFVVKKSEETAFLQVQMASKN